MTSNDKPWCTKLCVWVYLLLFTSLGAVADPLFLPSNSVPKPSYLESEPWRTVRIDEAAFQRVVQGQGHLELELFDGEVITVHHRKSFENPSGSVSWIGAVDGDPRGLVVLVHREGVTLGSIRTDDSLFMLAYVGQPDGAHGIYRVDESLPRYQEDSPTAVNLDPERLAAAERAMARQVAGEALEDDGSVQDLLVVYTPLAQTEVGGQVAIETLIDLGVTETNLSYETSGIHHRIRLVGTALTDYDEKTTPGCPRDLLQDPNDGLMDEVHPLRDEVAADLVKLVTANGCGRAFIMSEVSTAHEEFAFCYTSHVCLSPGYTFQHELGHIQAGLHQRTGPPGDSPFLFNYGYVDPPNRFRTIMAAGDNECPNGCPRRLAWSNPDVLDSEAGVPMGIPEGDPEAADNRKTLNATAWVVANFRVSTAPIFFDGFESGDFSGWTELIVP